MLLHKRARQLVAAMPTNLFGNRSRPKREQAPDLRAPQKSDRIVCFRIAERRLRARLHDTPTADRIWLALPLFAPAETWGDSIHFEIPVESGRDRTAKLNGAPGEIYFWSDDDRIIFAFGPTPISRPDEVRLPRPCNVWAEALDDPEVFRGVTPGEKITVERLSEPPMPHS